MRILRRNLIVNVFSSLQYLGGFVGVALCSLTLVHLQVNPNLLYKDAARIAIFPLKVLGNIDVLRPRRRLLFRVMPFAHGRILPRLRWEGNGAATSKMARTVSLSQRAWA